MLYDKINDTTASKTEIYMESQNTFDLSSALARCRQSAQNGYETASAQLGKIEQTLRAAREETERSVTLLNGKSVYLTDLNRLLSRQIKDICKAFSLLFFSQLFVSLPQTTILPFCISFSWGWS